MDEIELPAASESEGLSVSAAATTEPLVPEMSHVRITPPRKHPLCEMACMFRDEACKANAPVASSLLRLADVFDARAKELS